MKHYDSIYDNMHEPFEDLTRRDVILPKEIEVMYDENFGIANRMKKYFRPVKHHK